MMKAKQKLRLTSTVRPYLQYRIIINIIVSASTFQANRLSA